MTRLQRASKGSSQSTGRGGDNVIQGSGVRLQDRRRHLVMLRYGAMHSEYYGPLFGWKVRPAHRALNALYAHIGTVNHLRHNDRMVSRKNTHGDTGRPNRRPLGTCVSAPVVRPLLSIIGRHTEIPHVGIMIGHLSALPSRNIGKMSTDHPTLLHDSVYAAGLEKHDPPVAK